MSTLYFREFQTLWFQASVNAGIRLSVSGEDYQSESFATASCPPIPVPVSDSVHDRILRTMSVTQVQLVVKDPGAGPELDVSSEIEDVPALSWTRNGSLQYANVDIPNNPGDFVDVKITIVAAGTTTYTRVQSVRVKHRASTGGVP